jgi:ABC-type lipoprotein export system ATPase subunit
VSQPVVELRDVFCVHRTNQGDAAALQGTNLELAAGELLCVLGPSGAGKSTLLRLIAGIQTPSAGTVYVLGSDIGRLPPRARARIRHRRLGFVGQDTEAALPPDLPVAQAVGLPLALRGVRARTRRARVDELLEAAALRERADAYPGELPAASVSGTPCAPRSPTVPRCCSPTSPPGSSTRRVPKPCAP